jgi:hypothetical protein
MVGHEGLGKSFAVLLLKMLTEIVIKFKSKYILIAANDLSEIEQKRLASIPKIIYHCIGKHETKEEFIDKIK